MTAESKGSGFNTSMKIWRELLTADEHRRVYESVPQAVRDLVDNPPLAIAWVLSEIQYTWSEHVHRLFGARGLALVQDVGRLMLLRDLSGIYKVLLRVSSVDYALAQSSKMYSTYTRDSGSLVAERLGPNRIAVKMRDAPVAEEYFLWFISGTVLGVMEAVGAKNARVAERVPKGPRDFDIVVDYD